MAFLGPLSIGTADSSIPFLDAFPLPFLVLAQTSALYNGVFGKFPFLKERAASPQYENTTKTLGGTAIDDAFSRPFLRFANTTKALDVHALAGCIYPAHGRNSRRWGLCVCAV